MTQKDLFKSLQTNTAKVISRANNTLADALTESTGGAVVFKYREDSSWEASGQTTPMNLIRYKTTDGSKYDFEGMREVWMSQAPEVWVGVPINRCVEQGYDDESQLWTAKFERNITLLGINVDIDGRIVDFGPFFTNSDVLFVTAHVTEVEIPSSVRIFGSMSMIGEADIRDIKIPDTVTVLVEGAMTDNPSLTGITIGSNLNKWGVFEETTVGLSAPVYQNKSLKHVYVSPYNASFESPDGCECVVDKRNHTLVLGTNSTIVPTGVTQIGLRAFQGLTGITSVVLPSSITKIDYRAFMDSSIKSVVLSLGLTTIKDGAFDSTKLTAVTIPSTVTEIGEEAFRNCELTNVTIGTGITSLPKRVFAENTQLNSISYLGNSVQWSRITLASDWKTNVPANVVHCTDIDVPI